MSESKERYRRVKRKQKAGRRLREEMEIQENGKANSYVVLRNNEISGTLPLESFELKKITIL